MVRYTNPGLFGQQIAQEALMRTSGDCESVIAPLNSSWLIKILESVSIAMVWLYSFKNANSNMVFHLSSLRWTELLYTPSVRDIQADFWRCGTTVNEHMRIEQNAGKLTAIINWNSTTLPR